jgi:hypothetical protein
LDKIVTKTLKLVFYIVKSRSEKRKIKKFIKLKRGYIFVQTKREQLRPTNDSMTSEFIKIHPFKLRATTFG